MKFYCIDIEAATEAVDIVPRDQETKTFPPHSLESDEGNQEDMLIPYVITPKKKPPCENKMMIILEKAQAQRMKSVILRWKKKRNRENENVRESISTKRRELRWNDHMKMKGT